MYRITFLGKHFLFLGLLLIGRCPCTSFSQLVAKEVQGERTNGAQSVACQSQEDRRPASVLCLEDGEEVCVSHIACMCMCVRVFLTCSS